MNYQELGERLSRQAVEWVDVAGGTDIPAVAREAYQAAEAALSLADRVRYADPSYQEFVNAKFNATEEWS